MDFAFPRMTCRKLPTTRHATQGRERATTPRRGKSQTTDHRSRIVIDKQI